MFTSSFSGPEVSLQVCPSGRIVASFIDLVFNFQRKLDVPEQKRYLDAGVWKF